MKINQHFLIGEPVKDLGDTNWTCMICTHWSSCGSVIYRSYMSEEKHADKTICSHDTVSHYKGRGHVQCHGNFITAPSWWNSLFRQQPWYSSLHKKSIKCVYLSFPSGNSENTEQFSLGETAVNVFPPKWLQQHCDLLSHVITNKTSAISNPEGPQTDA